MNVAYEKNSILNFFSTFIMVISYYFHLFCLYSYLICTMTNLTVEHFCNIDGKLSSTLPAELLELENLEEPDVGKRWKDHCCGSKCIESSFILPFCVYSLCLSCK